LQQQHCLLSRKFRQQQKAKMLIASEKCKIKNYFSTLWKFLLKNNCLASHLIMVEYAAKALLPCSAAAACAISLINYFY
jgi:hypothetical protein